VEEHFKMELLLAAALELFDGDLRKVATEYSENTEFRRKIDIGAYCLASNREVISSTIH
jgi:hypothetical protein